MTRDGSRFVQEAVRRSGATTEEAQRAAELLVLGEAWRDPQYPCIVSQVVGYRGCRVTADLEDGALVLRQWTWTTPP
jgi:hypothetical protein